jgi:hypothetical protein
VSVNKYKPHVFVIPEDDADRQIADGFVLHPRVAARQVQVVEPAGGWIPVLETFKKEYIPHLNKYNGAHVVMLIDFDGKPEERRKIFEAEIPETLRTRVFVIGPHETPESLRQSLGKGGYEDIGRSLADDCDGDNLDVWTHAELQHNDDERLRLVGSVKTFLFN